jgi:chromatin segregation and condensation protein Rec8/ScpA/Scc1 (kleisin family)
MTLLRSSRQIEFLRLFYACSERQERVVLFLAMLELGKNKQIAIVQEVAFNEIIIGKMES